MLQDQTSYTNMKLAGTLSLGLASRLMRLALLAQILLSGLVYTEHTFTIENDRFLKDNEAAQLISGR